MIQVTSHILSPSHTYYSNNITGLGEREVQLIQYSPLKPTPYPMVLHFRWKPVYYIIIITFLHSAPGCCVSPLWPGVTVWTYDWRKVFLEMSAPDWLPHHLNPPPLTEKVCLPPLTSCLRSRQTRASRHTDRLTGVKVKSASWKEKKIKTQPPWGILMTSQGSSFMGLNPPSSSQTQLTALTFHWQEAFPSLWPRSLSGNEQQETSEVWTEVWTPQNTLD